MEEACGVFGCVAAGPWPANFSVGQKVVHGLTGLQHRGQESAGLVTSVGDEGQGFFEHKGMGLVTQVFKDVTKSLSGNVALGHTRYSTSGSSSIANCQPFVVETFYGKIAVAHNGQLINTGSLKDKILKQGVGLRSSSDTELITQLLSRPPPDEQEVDGPNWVARIKRFMEHSFLSYSLVIMYKDRLIALRDPFGNRPLCIGQLVKDGSGWVVSSESCSFPSVGAKFHSYVKPGEIVEISHSGIKSLHKVERPQNRAPAFCIFEYVYFSRPDSLLEGQLVHTARKRCGRQLAIEFPVIDADIISTVPDSASAAAIGYSEQLGIPHGPVLWKNGLVGRTFICPTPESRKLAVAMKFGILTDSVVGKKIVLIDDSIVRGSTIGPIVRLLKEAGALQVHVRIASPPVKHPCYMGINMPTKEELIANQMTIEELEEHVDADSIRYLSLEGLVESVRTSSPDHSDGGYCSACLSGQYPIELEW